MTDPGIPSPEVAILLATYNGERYLGEQLDSLLAQTHRQWKLFIRDDGSSDSTRAMLARYCERDSRIVQVDPSGKNVGPLRSFATLLQHADDFAYAMFCDQDDEWLPDKITISLERMVSLERKHPAAPVLVHSDLVVTGPSGEALHPSFWTYSGTDPLVNGLSRLLFQNTVTGCTALVNRSLLDMLQEIPSGAVMHDWWAALVAACFGLIEPLPTATVKYRQHSGNVIGARERATLPFVKAAGSLAADPGFWQRRRRELLEVPLEQAAALLGHFGNRLPPPAHELLKALSGLEQMPWWKRRHFLVQQGCMRQRPSHNAALLLLA